VKDEARHEVRKLDAVVEEAERDAIERALRAESGNLLRTAKALGIERNTLKRKLHAFGLYPSRDDA
jgi:DNA-binding NtrC family response regulator